ncbi:NAD(P)-dependent alcohol dehydrogenase [Pseudonocardia sp. ICBG1034]|uniref:NAD(P)-dependent alcohol dehydrogenase n=1 Tax=Pseudonocardia sp. ICBG1034 TaxID=2844381 RepID=UPI001CC9AE28|nr:NAD(P)-dependent alcohol dehydrogenase [Pseudonocardia sp. ICBG1034]
MSVSARAAVLETKDGAFEMRDITVDEPRPDEVLVRIVATGICATDAHVRARRIATPLPVVLGHEGAGVVERVGAAVTAVRPGDHVVLSFHSCGVCPPCVAAHPAYCDRVWDANFAGARLDGTNGLHAADGAAGVAPRGHFFGQSSFATYALAHQRNTVKVPADVPLDVLAPLGCGFQTGAGAVLTALGVTRGSSFAVFGTGAVGLAAVMAARIAGAATVIAVDVEQTRLDLARELGATHVVDAGRVDDLSAALRAVVPRGTDFALDTSGRTQNLTAGVDALAPMGRFGFVAFHDGADAMVDASRLAVGQSLHGIIQGDAVSALLINELISLHRDGRFPIDRLTTHYDFADIDTAFDDVASGAVLKAVLRFPTPA